MAIPVWLPAVLSVVSETGPAYRVRSIFDAATSEADLQRTVIEMAQAFGWRVFHVRPARTAKGWRTPVEADGAGFPDLVLARPRDESRGWRRRRLIFCECKRERGRLSDAQSRWADVLDGWEYYVVRPSDLATIEEVLR